MGVTFKEVAERAGVSTQTVSRVTNGSPSVAPRTRERVLAAIEELGYTPNQGAQMLSRGKVKLLGLITLDIHLHGISLIASSIRRHAELVDHGVSISVVSDPELELLHNAIRKLRAQSIEAMIINVPVSQECAEQLVEHYPHLHLVFIDVPATANVPSVCANHFDGALAAAKHLAALDRQHFVLIAGPQHSFAASERLRAWQSALHAEQIVATYEGDWSTESGYLKMREHLVQGQPVDAVLVASDQMALGALRALHEYGLSVPAAVSIVGFDNMQDSAFFQPPLTTIEQDFQQIGQMAVKQALDPQPRHQELPTHLIERKSTAKPQQGNEQPNAQALLQQLSKLIDN
ncbi:LacI family DNA-binding transcriptional regulator [Aliagarivorans marinus]|uniref:LacI family DNA-binding transcriptional regulator n=1 Tax=Aliagarivorans marinus TaxID=561965 RepID=UPI000404C642|nr:LacI family DNA-binding transcriptional regulator [Aliagarivorans marinus]